KAHQLEPKLYDGNVIKNTCAIVIPDSKETLILAEEGHSKMILKQQDPMNLEKKVNTKPIYYVVHNRLSQDFKKRFVPQTKLSAKQAFWSQNSMNFLDPSPSSTPTRVKVPKELPKALKTQSWLWYRRMSHLNFGIINHLARHNLVRENGTEFVNQTLRDYYKEVDISHETSVARSPQQNGVIERRNHKLIEGARTMLIYAKASLFLWAEAVATACYTLNHSIIRLRYGKTPHELLHDKLPDLSFFYVFGALCYLTNDSESLGKLQSKVDIAMASEHSSLELALHEMNPATVSSGLVPNPPPLTPYVPTTRTNWDILFQPLFDKLLNLPSSVDLPAPELIAPTTEVVAPVLAASTGSPFSTTVDQDVPSPKSPKTSTFCNDTLHESLHEDLTSQG
nr:hypothetical protein [Tanacetum cinerariifolium]